MRLETAVIIGEKDELSGEIGKYCKGHFEFKKVMFFEKFSQIKNPETGKTLILCSSEQLIDSDEMILMSQYIRKYETPVLIYSMLNESELNHIIDAIELGAIDVIPAKIFTEKGISQAEAETFDLLIESINRGIFKLDINLLKNRLYPVPIVYKNKVPTDKTMSITIMGCDIGGISAILSFIPQLPASYPSSVCVLMNGNPRLLDAVADRLCINSAIKVRRVVDDIVVEPSTVYIIAANQAPVLDSFNDGSIKIILNKSLPFEISLKHWIDQFMLNAVEIFGKNTIGILLAGIQEDGIMGLEKIKKANGTTIIQSNKSCIFPKRLRMALRSDCAQHAVYLGDLAETLLSLS